jgi:hypothetical protein
MGRTSLVEDSMKKSHIIPERIRYKSLLNFSHFPHLPVEKGEGLGENRTNKSYSPIHA